MQVASHVALASSVVMQDLAAASDTAASRARARFIKKKRDKGLYAAGCSHVHTPLFGLSRCSHARGDLAACAQRGAAAGCTTGPTGALKKPRWAPLPDRKRDKNKRLDAVWRWLAVTGSDAADMLTRGKDDDGKAGGADDSCAHGHAAQAEPGSGTNREPEFEPGSTEPLQIQLPLPLTDATEHDHVGAVPVLPARGHAHAAQRQVVATESALTTPVQAAPSSTAVTVWGQSENVSCDDLAEQWLRRS